MDCGGFVSRVSPHEPQELEVHDDAVEGVEVVDLVVDPTEVVEGDIDLLSHEEGGPGRVEGKAKEMERREAREGRRLEGKLWRKGSTGVRSPVLLGL